MTSVAQIFRRNLILAVVLHAGLIGAIVAVEGLASKIRTSPPFLMEVVMPAAPLGEMPKGPGHGTGAYAPPAEPVQARAAFGPGAENLSADEEAAPVAKPVAKPAAKPIAKAVEPTAHDPNGVSISKKTTANQKKTGVTAKSAVTQKSTTTATTTGKTTSGAKAGAKTGGGTAMSAADIRRHFADALRAAGEGGTPYGDGKPMGGGNATGGKYGSPNGSPDGIPGGVGQGSSFWQYYLHVHDKMYEAWERPDSAADLKKGLMARVMIRVARDGRILEVSLKDSSGNKLMDDSAMAAARRVPRLDPLPDGLGEAFKDITVDFELES